MHDAAKVQDERSLKNLHAAVKTMREACDTAERRINEGRIASSAEGVLNALAWGFANATSSLENAMSANNDAALIRLVQAKKSV
jgi:hypothetical protein